jgi:hypothetical protein
MVTEVGTTDSRWRITALGLHLEFAWTGDRWTHGLSVGQPPEPIPAVRAIEADPSPDDPARVISPAYQEVQFQPGTDRLGALLLGQAGRHHFSAVFTVWEEPSATCIAVDVADRCRYAPAALACTYQVDLPHDTPLAADEARVTWTLDGGRLTLEVPESSRIVRIEQTRRAPRLRVEARIDPNNHTQRCHYGWRWMVEKTAD